jgi:hypothetical protein
VCDLSCISYSDIFSLHNVCVASAKQTKAVYDASRSYIMVRNNLNVWVLEHRKHPGRMIPATAEEAATIAVEIHYSGGHKGRDSTQKTFAMKYFFPGINEFIAIFQRYCSGCQAKILKAPPKRLTLATLNLMRLANSCIWTTQSTKKAASTS